ncbi:Maltose O-acetyltransferase [Carpediemonas membranifera]|uniref:Maltose O-acetyltransferase n=1 Tax=Carpediemonas membranifera TaxID=201153 RepID=A0A8J6B0T9_9EUKA|nr:Maltose O-acetyltransferase [Carpediemonas membranifera]|eukprot:KAG9396875.1 Maltose O-acetyltransferase [Carpediemonas membranifera]
MIAGEAYDAWDTELVDARIAARYKLKALNVSIPMTPEWREAINSLIPGSNDAFIEPPFRCDYGTNIHLDRSFYANFNCTMLDICPITIGENVMLGPNVQLYTAAHPLDVQGRVVDAVEFGKPIIISDNVWIGGGAIICPGVTVGANSVIGAGSVVTMDVPSDVVAAGNPCRVIRPIDNGGASGCDKT